MAAEFVGGAVLGTALSLLCDGLIVLIKTNLVYRSHIEEIKCRLEMLEPVFKQMSNCNQELSYPDVNELNGLEKVLMRGKELVDKCRNISKKNFIQQCRCELKLIKWEEDFQKQIDGIIVLQGIRDVKKTGVAVIAVMKEVKKIEVSTKKTEDTTQEIKTMIENFREEMKTMMVNQMVNQMGEDVFKPRCEIQIPELPPHPVGLDGPLNELKEKLLNDNGLSKLILFGPAGCGKTALVSMFCRDQEVKGIFEDNIIFLTFSKDPKMDRIVQQLYQQKGKKVPTFTDALSLERAESLVQTFIKEEGKRPLLLVLDDVCSRSGSLLQMFKLKETLDLDYKVLVTSRSRFEAFASTLNVELLKDKEAMELFSHFASLEDLSSHIPKDVAKEIVDKCQGLPVALKMIGQSLCGKNEPVWRAKPSQWSGSGFSSMLETDDELLRCLQSSIDDLYDVARECFLDFGLFPQSKYIPVATLFDMWAELYGLSGDNECIAELLQLSSRSLAKFVDGREVKMEANGYYSQHFVIQLGLLRELAIYISKQVNEVEARERLIVEITGANQLRCWGQQKTMKARLLSISTDVNFSKSKEWPKIELPNAEVLVLFFQTQDYVLPEFVDKMPELKVLVITCDRDYEFGAALESWIHCPNPLSNLKIIILEGISIPSITKIVLALASVKKISLSRCYKVSEAFRDPVKISKFFPKLEVLNIDFCNLKELPADLGNLKLLRELNITNCCGLKTLPEETKNLVKLEFLRLSFCRDFSKFQHSIKLERLKSLDLAYCSSIEELPKYIGKLSSLKKLDIRNCPALNELPQSISDLENLEVVICSSKTKLLTECLPHGKHIPMVAPTLEWEDWY